MGTQLGRLMVLQYETETPGTWANLCGLDTMSLNITNSLSEEEKVPCTTRSDTVQKIVTYGMQGITAEISGLFDDDAAGLMVHDAAFDQDTMALRAFIPGWCYLECDNWFLGSDAFNGAATGSLNFSTSLTASGTVTKTDV